MERITLATECRFALMSIGSRLANTTRTGASNPRSPRVNQTLKQKYAGELDDMFNEIHKFFAYCVVMLARPKEAAEATNEAETHEQLDEYIMAIYRGQTPTYKRKKRPVHRE